MTQDVSEHVARGEAAVLTVVVPVFNECDVLPEFHRRLTGVLLGLPMQCEVLYVNDGSTDGSLGYLEALCATLPGIRLHVHGARQGDALQAAGLGDAQGAEFWFCGPSGLAEALRAGLARMGRRPRFHQEAFEMR